MIATLFSIRTNKESKLFGVSIDKTISVIVTGCEIVKKENELTQ